MATDVLPDVTVADLLLDGRSMSSQVVEAVTAASVSLSIDQASTLDLTLHDPERTLLRSGIFGARVTVTLDAYLFELVRVAKQGSALALTFEDAAIADLRRQKTPRKAAADTTTRTQFVRQMVVEPGWIGFVGAPGGGAKIELARGKPDETPGATSTDEDPEDSWSAIARLADEIDWRRFAHRGVVTFAPDDWLLARGSVATIAEFAPGVDLIDYEFDAGQPTAAATITARAGRWQVPPGSAVTLANVGPADGLWLVAAVSRSLTSTSTIITLTRARPALPEPDPPADPGIAPDPSPKPTGAPVPVGAVSGAGFTWPTAGRVSSTFGAPRPGGRKHAGIDIAAATGTPVKAAAAGTVASAGEAGGYGLLVVLAHPDNVETRYAHLSAIKVRTGQKLDAGQVLGLVGNTGNSSGPHLHFETRRGGAATDPSALLPKR